ncbi:MAG: thioredoxin [Nanoarchaeota archaeon]|nr:thioredoxin [Nanoarchaeota archaeon]MBU4242150.1 thioredoxin [Nanoarchaeota archaeon]MBU4352426.1 thioredoxin [Nanoarchaeota archaeon]MBU4455936.1 thioredoxin [Nanoarchaeota archaeon]MCG2720367.1 thioredoxin [Nanoarchaeota archaeon]
MKIKSLITILLPLTLSCATPSQETKPLVEEYPATYVPQIKTHRDLLRAELMKELTSLKNKKIDEDKYVPKNIETLTKKNFNNNVLENKLPVIVEFSIDGCRYCDKVKPDFDEICGKYKAEMKCYEINVTDANLINAKYKLEYFPTFGFFNKGTSLKKHWFDGAASKRLLEKSIKDFLDDVKKKK